MTKTYLDRRELQKCASSFRILAHPKRIQIVELLQKKPMYVNEIQKGINLSQAETSHHLHLLLETNVIINKREGKRIFYSINPQRLKQVFIALETLGF